MSNFFLCVVATIVSAVAFGAALGVDVTADLSTRQIEHQSIISNIEENQ